MLIDWNHTHVRINQTGRSAGIAGQRMRWREPVADYDLWFVFRGEGVMRGKDNAVIPLRPGTCLWLSPGYVYEVTHDPANPLTNYYVHFDLLDQQRHVLPYNLKIPSERVDVGDGVLADAVMRRIVELIPFYDAPIADQFPHENLMIAENLFRGLLMDLDRASKPDSHGAPSGTRRHHRELIMRCVAQMQDGPVHQITIRHLAKDCGYSLEHFSRVFREVMGQSAEEFLIGLRVDRAKHLLKNSSMGVEEISRLLGYRHATFFSSQFRQRTGFSPSRYRHRYNKAVEADGNPTKD